jgi:hypothetical protein
MRIESVVAALHQLRRSTGRRYKAHRLQRRLVRDSIKLIHFARKLPPQTRCYRRGDLARIVVVPNRDELQKAEGCSQRSHTQRTPLAVS